MTTKVLVAEDSLTVQKVINFTLESEPFELDYCKDEDELFSKFEKGKYNLVFLDMNLSSNKTGYDLSKDLRVIDPDVSILALFGTFDVIEEGALEDAHIADKIVKPFESAKFIEVCRNLSGGDSGIPTQILPETEELEDDWTVDAPDMEVTSQDITPSNEEAAIDMKSWGIDIPEVIEEEIEAMPMDESLLEEGAELIDTMNLIEPELEEEEDEIALPSDSDLELPETSLNLVADNFDETREISQVPEKEISIEEDIEQDMSPEDFWAADETGVLDVEVELEKEEVPEIAVASNELTDEIMAKIQESIRPLIEQEVKKYCKEAVDKVAWEVIPDLAENLIRKEISKAGS